MAFTSGVVGLVKGDLDDIYDDHITEEVGNDTLNCYINVEQRRKDLSGEITTIQGKVATEKYLEQDIVEIENGAIRIKEERKSDWTWSNFWLVPSGRFIVAESTNGTFPFDKLSQSTGVQIVRANFNLTKIVKQYTGQWMGGFQDRPEQVRSGTLYGEEIETDIDMGEPFLESDKTQIGPLIEFDGQKLKARITKDGLVQVVAPGNYRRERYLSFIDEMLIQHTYS